MKAWHELTHFAGFDWAGNHHDVVIVDQAGLVVAEFRFAHSAEGWEQFRQKTQTYTALVPYRENAAQDGEDVWEVEAGVMRVGRMRCSLSLRAVMRTRWPKAVR